MQSCFLISRQPLLVSLREADGLIWLTLLQLSLLAILLFVLLFEQCNTMYTTLCHASSFHGQGHCKLGSVKRCVYLGLDNQFGCREGEGVGKT